MKKRALVHLTDKAVIRIKEIMAQNPNALGLFLSLKKGGCAGLEYDLSLAFEDQLQKSDKVEKEGAVLYIDKEAILYVLGMEIDFETALFKKAFTFHNPNEISSCGCGQSVSLKKAE